MFIFGVLANPISILVGTVLGLMLGRFLSGPITRRIELGLGFCIIFLGIKMALTFESALLLILSIGLGGVVGLVLKLEKRMENWVKHIQKRAHASGSDTFTTGFVTTSTLYCTGAMAIVGAIRCGTMGDNEILYAKSLLDGVLSISFASVYGVSVAFSAISVLLYQGGIALIASKLGAAANPHFLGELSGVGGVLLAMVGINLTGMYKISVIEFLPALPLAAIALKLM